MSRGGSERKKILNMIKKNTLSPDEGIAILKYQKMRESAKDIAVIGISGRFPGAKNTDEFWDNLSNGVDSVCEIPRERWDSEVYYSSDMKAQGKTYCKWGGTLTGADKFDPIFFNISPKEAEVMDPQQRLVLQESWKAIEDSGYTPSRLSGTNCGVFMGATQGDYIQRVRRSGAETNTQALNGMQTSMLSARISYFLNLRGPNITIDTACSSSLVAIHLACRSIAQGESSIALAGGVHIMTTPEMYIMTSRGGMLSQKGKCRTFDNDADGFAPGEGVGIVVLKRLCDALSDGDSIYAVIKGSAVGYDGKTNGITAPSAEAQTKLEQHVYDESGINPETISYVEAHGTGTKLGDPIELNALTQAFRKYTDKKGYCSIGSVKTNIGHGMISSGVCALIKVILCIKNKKLVPSLNFNKPNEYLDIENSPFKINTELKNWDVQGTFPRRAAISSFGLSGTNCHIVVEEAPNVREPASKNSAPWYLVVFSAKTKKSLSEICRAVYAFLQKGAGDAGLADIAFTLGVKRAHFPVRSYILAKDTAEFSEKLHDAIECFEDGEFARENSSVMTEEIEAGNEEIAALKECNDSEEYRKLLEKLGEKYAAGAAVNFERLYSQNDCNFVHLPTYCFDEQRYWITDGIAKTEKAQIHPLIGRNTSDLYETKYTTEFTGSESFILNHIIAGKKVIPGAAIAEMARAAGNYASQKPVASIDDIVFLKPIEVGKSGQRVDIILKSGSAQDAAFEIVETTVSGEKQVCAHGALKFGEMPKESYADLNALMETCKGGAVIVGADFYHIFDAMGVCYGEKFRVVDKIYLNGQECIAEIKPRYTDELSNFVLNPAVFDGTLQSVAVFKEKDKDGITYLPYSAGSIEIFCAAESTRFVHTTYLKGQSEGANSERTFNMELLDGKGRILAQIKNYVTKPVRLLSKKTDSGVLYFSHTLTEREIAKSSKPIVSPLLVFTCGGVPEKTVENIKNAVGLLYLIKPGVEYSCDDNCFTINPENPRDYLKLLDTVKEKSGLPASIINLWGCEEFESGGLEKSLVKTAYSLLYLGRALIENKLDHPVKILFVTDSDNPCCLAAESFAKSMRLEFPDIILKTIKINGKLKDIKIAEIMANELADNINDGLISYENGKRLVKSFSEMCDIKSKANVPQACLKENGVYIITGGTGGLGLIFARYLAEKYKARIVLCGRKEPAGEKAEAIKALNSAGKVAFIRADVSQPNEVADLVNRVKRRFGCINGVIHSAGVIKDSFIIKKKAEEMSLVFAPKINGLVNLDEALKDEKLDFFAAFSSLGAVTGNVGQCDYSYANGFIDFYIGSRDKMVERGERFGKSLAINWPLWKDGGMIVDGRSQQMMKSKLGMEPMSAQDGVEAFENCLHAAQPNIVVINGIKKKIRNYIMSESMRPVVGNVSPPEGDVHNIESVFYKAADYLKSVIGEAIGLAPEKIRLNEPFETYGIDSIMIVSLNESLEKCFGDISKTLFFEYRDLEELTGYFLKNHRDRLLSNLGETQNDGQNGVAHITTAQNTETGERNFGQNTNACGDNFSPILHENAASGDIAVIGVSGRYPKAAGLDEFWQNLLNGRDCISEIPKERWDYSVHFSGGKDNKGKYNSKWGGFIDDADKFDPLFFNMSPRDAEMTDPQERLFLQTSWEAVQNAGYSRRMLKNYKTGVFVGVMYGHYQMYGAEETLKGNPIGLNSSFSSVANRVSYFFDFHGPSIAVDTMCSSSLTSLHLACRSINTGECDMAIAGGVNLSLHENKYIMLGQGNFLSDDGRCRSFGDGGSGYVPGEGVGAVLLKPLEKAKADGDFIYAVIKSTAINHGGRTSGFTVPNPVEQGNVIAGAIEKANVDARTITYVESHGTGTPLGDPIEINGLARGFGAACKGKAFCSVGSVKSNIGHLESASGIAALTKVILMLQNKILVPSIHSEKLNPNLKLNGTPFYIQREVQDWEKSVINENGATHIYPRRAGISSFGAGGSNAHVIIEEYDEKANANTCLLHDKQIFVFSAPNSKSLHEYVCRIYNRVHELKEKDGGPAFESMAYTLQTGRDDYPQRLAVIASGFPELEEKLKAFLDSAGCEGVFAGRAKPDSDLPNQIETSGDITGYAEKWISGARIDWERFYSGQRPKRLTLPAFPLAKRRCWYTDFNGTAGNSSDTAETLSEKSADTAIQDDALDSSMDEMMLKYSGDEVSLDIVDDEIAVVTMQNRNNKNMFTNSMIDGLMANFAKIKHNKNIKAAVLTGYDNVFCMGGTQTQLEHIADETEKFSDAPFLFKGLLEMNIPVISAMQGHASGGGMMFGLYADIVIMAEESVYTASFMKYGFTPGMGATYILKEKLGGNLATEMMFTAKPFSGEELKKRGASVIIVKRGKVMQEAMKIARMIAQKPLYALEVLKSDFSGRVLPRLAGRIEREEHMHRLTFAQPEVRRRIKYFYHGEDRDKKEKAVLPPDREDRCGNFNAEFIKQVLSDLEQGKITPIQAQKLKDL